jgi:hypothetical protein
MTDTDRSRSVCRGGLVAEAWSAGRNSPWSAGACSRFRPATGGRTRRAAGKSGGQPPPSNEASAAQPGRGKSVGCSAPRERESQNERSPRDMQVVPNRIGVDHVRRRWTRRKSMRGGAPSASSVATRFRKRSLAGVSGLLFKVWKLVGSSGSLLCVTREHVRDDRSEGGFGALAADVGHDHDGDIAFGVDPDVGEALGV